MIELADQVTGQRIDVRIVENHRVGGAVLAGERAVEAIPQFNRHQRIHPKIKEPNRGCRGVRKP